MTLQPIIASQTLICLKVYIDALSCMKIITDVKCEAWRPQGL